MVERGRALVRPHAQLFFERGGAALELSQRRSPVAGEVLKSHQLPVRALVRAVVSKDERAVVQTQLELTLRLAEAHKLVEHDEVYVLQALALVEAPVLIPAFEQVAAVDLHGRLQGPEALGV